MLKCADDMYSAVVTDPPDGLSLDPDVLTECLRVSGGKVIMILSARVLPYILRFETPPDRVITWKPSLGDADPTNAVTFSYHPIAFWGVDSGSLPDTLRNPLDELDRFLSSTQKPVGLMEDLVSCLGAVKKPVLDPFMGTGSTGVACHNLGIDFVGVDIDITLDGLLEGRIDGFGLEGSA
jgi:hypothetical protein